MCCSNVRWLCACSCVCILVFFDTGKQSAHITIIIIAILFIRCCRSYGVCYGKYIGNICCLPRNHFPIIYGFYIPWRVRERNTYAHTHIDISLFLTKRKKKKKKITLTKYTAGSVLRVYDLIAFFAIFQWYLRVRISVEWTKYIHTRFAVQKYTYTYHLSQPVKVSAK